MDDPAPARDSPEAPPDLTAPYRAGRAFLTLGLVLLMSGVGAATGLAVGMAAKDLGNPIGDPDAMAAALLGSALGSALATYLATRWWASPLLRDKSPQGLGLWLPRAKTLILWGAIGGALAAAYLVLALAAPERGSTGGGPLAQAAVRGGISTLVWSLVVLLIAPLTEEVLFRGLMLKGLAASWGTGWACVVTTALFVSLHLPETLHYWPSTIFVLAMAIAALVARLWIGSLLPAVALHTGYNGMIVGCVYLTI